jgi:hypothetical protein
VDDSLESFVVKERDCSFGFCSSFREWMNDLTFCDDCGTDAHLKALNQSVNFKPTVTITMLGAKLYRSIRVLPLPVDSIGRKLHDCAQDVDWRSIKPYVSLNEIEPPLVSSDED